MKRYKSLVLFGITCISVFHGWFVVAALFAILFSFTASASWLIPLGILVDGYFGGFYEVPVLTLVAMAWFLFIELLKPVLLWHNSKEHGS